MQKFLNKYSVILSILLIAFLCLIFLFFGIDFYSILGSTESFYAVISKYIFFNNDVSNIIEKLSPLLEKPPLYFWLISKSILFFDSLNEVSIRFQNGVCVTFLIYFVYFFGKNVFSLKFGLFNAIILLTCLGFLLFSHLAFLNVIFVVFLTVALYFVFLASIVSEKKQKYCWWAFYFFCSLTILTKGFLGLILPFLVVVIYYSLIKKFKNIFSPINFIVGLLILISIVAPWFFELSRMFGDSVFSSYILKFDFIKFFSNLGFYLIALVFAFLPWTLFFIGYVLDYINKIILRFKNNSKFVCISVEQKLSLFFLINFIVALLVISLIGNDLSMILVLMPPLTVLTTYFLCSSEVNNSFRLRIVSFSTYFLAIFFTIATITFAFTYMFLPLTLFDKVQQFKNFVIIGINLLSILLLLKLKHNNLYSMISAYVFSMFFIIIFAMVHGFNLYYISGENELVTFSKYANTRNTKLVLFNIPKTPSVYVNFLSEIKFITGVDTKVLSKMASNEKDVFFVILKNRDFRTIFKDLNLNLYLIDTGAKYTILSNVKMDKKNISLTNYYNQ